MLGYLTFRFAIEFLKPRYAPWLGLSAIQVATLVGTVACMRSLIRRAGETRTTTTTVLPSGAS